MACVKGGNYSKVLLDEMKTMYDQWYHYPTDGSDMGGGRQREPSTLPRRSAFVRTAVVWTLLWFCVVWGGPWWIGLFSVFILPALITYVAAFGVSLWVAWGCWRDVRGAFRQHKYAKLMKAEELRHRIENDAHGAKWDDITININNSTVKGQAGTISGSKYPGPP